MSDTTASCQADKPMSLGMKLLNGYGAYLQHHSSPNQDERFWRDDLSRLALLLGGTFLVKHYSRLEVIGSENIPGVPSIIAPVRHCSHYDHIVNGVVFDWYRTRLAIGAAEDHFFRTEGCRYIFEKLLYAFPVDRSENARLRELLAVCKELLRTKSVLLYPEGGREYDGVPIELKSGFFFLVKHLGVPLVPVINDGTFKALRAKAWLLKPYKVTTRILPAFYPSDYEGLSARELMELYKERVSPYWRAL